MNILTLPEDILKEIWKFLDFNDVIRFGLIRKDKLLYSWKLADKLFVSNLATPEQLEWIAKLDLLHLRQAGFRFRPRKYTASQKIFGLSQLIKAPNLTSLTMDFNDPANYERYEQIQQVWPFLSAFTQLHDLTVLYEPMIIDCGHIARNIHLTSLTLNVQMLTNIRPLTTLRKLKLRFFMKNRSPTQLIEDISTTTNLRSLDTNLRYTNNYSWLTCMTNLEKFGIFGPSSEEIDVIGQLPKLDTLKIDFTAVFQNTNLDYSLLGNFTRLTKLYLRPYFSSTNFEALTKLTNLVKLTFIGNIPIEDFSHLQKITQLKLKNVAARPNLPPNLIFPSNLKKLVIQSPVFSDSICNAICTATNLQSLSIMPLSVVAVLTNNLEEIFTKQISKLSNLTHLQLPIFGSKELVQLSLRSLSNLVRLRLNINSWKLAEEFVQLTQLVSFTYVAENSLPNLTLNAPFVVKRLDSWDQKHPY